MPNSSAARLNRSVATAPGVVRVGSRRWFLQTQAAGLAGLSFAGLAAQRQAVAAAAAADRKSVIMFWLSGGPSHLDMWDPKPMAPAEIRGPFHSIETRVPGVRFCEHLPLHASLADRLTVVRSVDCSASNHTPITMQAGNPLARRTDNGRDGDGHPSLGSLASYFRGPNDPNLPAFVGLAPSWVSDVWGAGELGAAHAPLNGLEVAGKFGLPSGLNIDRLQDRDALRRGFDRLRNDLDQRNSLERFDRSAQQALEMVASGTVERAFDLSGESDTAKDAYGRGSVGEKALLARRLVEAGVTFVLVSGAWGYFDNHGDTVPPWGGIEKGLKPILPTIDQALFALITDLEQRGLLDSTLIVMMGEFGRTPVMSSDAGRGHWTNCMSLLLAGGGLAHGRSWGATDARGYSIAEQPFRPQDLAATVFRHLNIDLASHWMHPSGRPLPIVVNGGKALA